MRRFTKAITALFLIVATLAVTECKKDTDPNSAEFKIVKEYLDINATSASITGSFEYPGKINSIKVAVGQRHDFTDAHSFLADIHEKEFEVTITGLTTGTEYRYRYEVDYGSSKPFITEAKTFTTQSESPTVKVLELLKIDSTTFRITCEVLSDGGQEVTERGIYWNTYGDPTIGDNTLQNAEGGLGIYVIRMENLTIGKKYYVRAYAKNAAGIGLSENVLGFTVGASVVIKLSCNPEEGGTVSGGGSYEVGTNCTVIAEAKPDFTFVNWTENGDQVSSNTEYTFSVSVGRNLVANFSELQPDEYDVQVSANPNEGGTVTGGGSYQEGQSCTVKATTKPGFNFVNWTENGNQVSDMAEYTFTVTGNRILVANFSELQSNEYGVQVSANPSEGGTVTGGGTYQQGQSCTVKATTKPGFNFVNWTENGNQVSDMAEYTFTVTGNRILVANFTAQPQAPTGAINGLFSVSASKQVWFSQGNLQYIGSAGTPYWKFAENQWDYLGTTTGQNSSNHNVDRDLFGWGTSGWYNGNTYYMPFDTEDAYPSYYQYGPSGEHDLTGDYANADWGVYNPISNGGNVAGQWRTLTNSEWGYVLFTRTTPSGIRFAKAIVNDVNGVIVLPDDWVGSTYALSSINNREANYSNNIISASNWNSILQPHGAVFLPAGGSRAGTSVLYAGTNGYYWSTSYYNSYQARAVFFSNTQLKTGEPDFRYYGRSVRLVSDY